MLATSRYIHMLQVHVAKIKVWPAQRGGSTPKIFGRGCAWHAGRNVCTAGTVADCTQAYSLIEEIDAYCLLANKGYDSDVFADSLMERGIHSVIAPRMKHKAPRDYDATDIAFAGILWKIRFWN